MIITEPYIYRFIVRTYETNVYNRLKTESVFNFLQEAASGNAGQLGFGYQQLMPKGQFWVLSRIILNMWDTVSFNEELIIETWPKGVDKIFALRDFNIKKADGQKIGVATTAWLLMDIQRNRPVVFTPENFSLPEYRIPPAIDETPGKITEPQSMTWIENRKVLYSDLDVNRHVNNARYMGYLDDLYTVDFYRYHTLRSVQINYLKEITYGDEISIYMKTTDHEDKLCYVEGRNQHGVKVFQAIQDWKMM